MDKRPSLHSEKFKMNEVVDSFLSEKVSNLLLTWKVNSITVNHIHTTKEDDLLKQVEAHFNDTLSWLVFTSKPLGCVITNHLGDFLVRCVRVLVLFGDRGYKLFYKSKHHVHELKNRQPFSPYTARHGPTGISKRSDRSVAKS